MMRLFQITLLLTLLFGSSTVWAEASIQDFCVDLTEGECEDSGCEWVDDACQAVTVSVDAGTPDAGESTGGTEMPSDADSDSSGCSMGGGHHSGLIHVVALLGLCVFRRQR